MVLELVNTPTGSALILRATDELEIQLLAVFARLHDLGLVNVQLHNQPLTAHILTEPDTPAINIIIRRPKP